MKRQLWFCDESWVSAQEHWCRRCCSQGQDEGQDARRGILERWRWQCCRCSTCLRWLTAQWRLCDEGWDSAQGRWCRIAKAVHRGDAGVRTPGEGSLSGEEGSAVDARRVDDGSLHNGGFVTRAGAQLKSTGVAEAVCKDKTRVRTPGDGSLRGGGGSAVDARSVDDGSLQIGRSSSRERV